MLPTGRVVIPDGSFRRESADYRLDDTPVEVTGIGVFTDHNPRMLARLFKLAGTDPPSPVVSPFTSTPDVNALNSAISVLCGFIFL